MLVPISRYHYAVTIDALRRSHSDRSHNQNIKILRKQLFYKIEQLKLYNCSGNLMKNDRTSNTSYSQGFKRRRQLKNAHGIHEAIL